MRFMPLVLIPLLALSACNTRNGRAHYEFTGPLVSTYTMGFGPLSVSCPFIDRNSRATFDAALLADGNLDPNDIRAAFTQLGQVVNYQQGVVTDLTGAPVTKVAPYYVKIEFELHYTQLAFAQNSYRLGSGGANCMFAGGVEMDGKVTCIVPYHNTPMVSASQLEATSGALLPVVQVSDANGKASAQKLINGCYFDLKSDMSVGNGPGKMEFNTKGFLKLAADYGN